MEQPDIQEDVPCLIYANKQDLPNALTPQEIILFFELNKLTRSWFLIGTSFYSSSGDGIYEGLYWLHSNMK